MKAKINIPSGQSREDCETRKQIILQFYRDWKSAHKEQRLFNIDLQDYINIRHISIDETSTKASGSYLSTLAVLQLDAILTNSKLISVVNTKQGNSNQKMFEKMLIMQYDCFGIGNVKLTVGIKRNNKEKIQYCITAILAK